MRANIARWRVAKPRAAALLLSVVTLACAGATPARYKSLNQEWQQAEVAARSSDATDALFDGAAFLDRRELIRQVLDRNPTLHASRYAWRVAIARYPQVTALEDPMLGVGIAPRSLGSSAVNSAPKFDLSQKLPFPGKLALRGAAAMGEAEAASHDFAAVRLRLATMASILFDDYYLVARSLEINAEHIALVEEFRRIATSRYESGEGAQQDPIQAEVELTHAQHRDLVLETRRRIIVDQMNALLHRLPDRELPPPPPRATIPSELAGGSDQLTTEALEQRPELAAARARVDAEEARVGLARREYFPDFTAIGSYNRLWQARDLQPFVGVQLNVPLRLARRKAVVDEAEARLEQARSQQHAIADEVRLGVHSGADRLEEARHVERLFRDRLVPAARDQVNAARSGFETGRNSFLALIDAERNLLDVELGYQEALADLGRRRTELDRALGQLPGLTW